MQYRERSDWMLPFNGWRHHKLEWQHPVAPLAVLHPGPLLFPSLSKKKLRTKKDRFGGTSQDKKNFKLPACSTASGATGCCHSTDGDNISLSGSIRSLRSRYCIPATLFLSQLVKKEITHKE